MVALTKVILPPKREIFLPSAKSFVKRSITGCQKPLQLGLPQVIPNKEVGANSFHKHQRKPSGLLPFIM